VRTSQRADDLVELHVQRFAVAVLLLDEEDHQERDHRRPRVDHELPSVTEMEIGPRRRPRRDDEDRRDERARVPDRARRRARESPRGSRFTRSRDVRAACHARSDRPAGKSKAATALRSPGQRARTTQSLRERADIAPRSPRWRSAAQRSSHGLGDRLDAGHDVQQLRRDLLLTNFTFDARIAVPTGIVSGPPVRPRRSRCGCAQISRPTRTLSRRSRDRSALARRVRASWHGT
jgi:hypothetical protein